MTSYDLIIIGGGLAGGLLADWLVRYQPSCRFLLIEKGERFGGRHTWSFHEGDLQWNDTSHRLDDLKKFDLTEWGAHEISFPGLRQIKKQRYFSLDASNFDRRLRRILNPSQYVCAQSARYDAQQKVVSLSDGRQLSARVIVMTVGPEMYSGPELTAYQKFVGLRIKTKGTHGLKHAVLMDAELPQHGSFRFMYVLPFTKDTLLLEDTYYSTNPTIDHTLLEKRIFDYARQKGWLIDSVLDREWGCLPIPLDPRVAMIDNPNKDKLQGSEPLILRAGMAAGLFHPTTGYSLAEAVRFAEWFCPNWELPLVELRHRVYAYQNEMQKRSRFYAGLNNMLFCAGLPEERYQILRGFYDLDDELIERFYALRLNSWDKLRLLWNGRNLVPLIDGLKAFLGQAEVKHDEQLFGSS